jgi:hypothetical protein
MTDMVKGMAALQSHLRKWDFSADPCYDPSPVAHRASHRLVSLRSLS